MVAKGVDGLLAERARGRRGKHRETEETKNSNTKSKRRDNGVLAVGGARESSEPSVGVGRVQAAKRL